MCTKKSLFCEVDAVILAAGTSSRMGCNKLLLPLAGKTVIERFFEQFPFSLFQRVIVVCADRRIQALAGNYPVRCCYNDYPGEGKSRSIRTGLDGCEAADGVMFLVADQPLLKPSTITRLVSAFSENRQRIVQPESGGRRRNPVLFPADLIPELYTLEGDSGGREVIARHRQRVYPVHVDAPEQFLDIDICEAYQKVVALWKTRHR